MSPTLPRSNRVNTDFVGAILHLPIPVEERVEVSVFLPECSFLIPPLWHRTSPSHRRRRCGADGSNCCRILQVFGWLARRVSELILAGSFGGTRDKTDVEQVLRIGCELLSCFHICFSSVISLRLACWYRFPATALQASPHSRFEPAPAESSLPPLQPARSMNSELRVTSRTLTETRVIRPNLSDLTGS